MDFEPYDSSGTDDDLPPSHQNRIPRGRLAANGRSSVIGSAPYSRVYGENDMETEIHNIEKEAYYSVLRAFKAQADAITWEKEAIISDLKRELRLSDEEHRELIGRANADETIRRIRDWRMVSGVQTGINTNQVGHDRLPSPAVSASRKKQKVVSSAHQSFGGPSPLYHSQGLSNPQSSSAAKKGQNIGPKGKKQKPSMQFPSSGTAGRGQNVNRISSGVLADEPSKARDPLIGKKVKTRWPDDNNFYEAIITDFDPIQGRHALIYDAGSANETWEWVNLAEISPSDIRWEGGDPGISRASYGPGHGINRPVGHDGTLGAGRGSRLPKGSNRRDYPPAQNGAAKKGPSIRLLDTSHLIKEAERVFTSNNPDPLEIDKAKKALKEQEEALIDALGMLADVSEGESD